MWDVIVWSDNQIDFVPSEWANEDCTQYKYPVGLSETTLRKKIYDCEDLTTNFEWADARLKKRSIKDLKKAKEACSKIANDSSVDITDDNDATEDELVSYTRKRTVPLRFLDNEVSSKKTRKGEGVGKRHFYVPKMPSSPSTSASSAISNDGDKGLGSNMMGRYVDTTDQDDDGSQLNFASASTITVVGNSSDESTQLADDTTDHNSNYVRIKFELQEINKRLDRMENNMLITQSSAVNEGNKQSISSVMNMLPAKTNNDIENLNQKISSLNVMERQELITAFSLLGGDNPRKTVFFIMNKLFSKNLATEYSGQGKKKKKSFCSTNLYDLVIAATREQHARATEDDIKKNIGLFLASAKQRLPK